MLYKLLTDTAASQQHQQPWQQQHVATPRPNLAASVVHQQSHQQQTAPVATQGNLLPDLTFDDSEYFRPFPVHTILKLQKKI